MSMTRSKKRLLRYSLEFGETFLNRSPGPGDGSDITIHSEFFPPDIYKMEQYAEMISEDLSRKRGKEIGYSYKEIQETISLILDNMNISLDILSNIY